MRVYQKISCLTRSPTAMQKSLNRREKDFVRKQTDDNDDEHDGDDLIHRAQFAAIVQKLSQSKAGQDGNENLGGHERAPGEGPTLFHAANDKGKGGRQDNFEPNMQVL